MSFTAKLEASEERTHSLLSLGLDPDPDLLPAGLAPTPAGTLEFLGRVIEATTGLVASYKLNLAFYERWGRDGSGLLADTLALIPQDAPVILDGKRGDIGSTAAAYAHALFEAWRADAVTVSPYLGYDSVAPFLAHQDKGVFIVCRTSNAGAADVTEGTVAKWLKQVGETVRQGEGLVAGATAPAELRDIRQIAEHRLLLVPGIGAQGADLERAVRAALRPDGRGALIVIGRGILFASSGPDYAEAARAAATGYRDAVNALRSEPAGLRS